MFLKSTMKQKPASIQLENEFSEPLDYIRIHHHYLTSRFIYRFIDKICTTWEIPRIKQLHDYILNLNQLF